MYRVINTNCLLFAILLADYHLLYVAYLPEINGKHTGGEIEQRASFYSGNQILIQEAWTL